MKIAFLTDGIFPLDVGGMAKHSYYLVKALLDRGVRVDLYGAVDRPDQFEAAPLTDGPGAESSLRTHVLERIRSPSLPGHYPWDCYRTSRRIHRELAERADVDFVYAQGLTGWYSLREKPRERLGAPVGVHPHGLEMYQKAASPGAWLKNHYLRPFFRWNLRNADYVFSFGGKIGAIIRSLGVPDGRILRAKNGIEASWLDDRTSPSNGSEERSFVFVGRDERRKGIQELHQVIGQLHDEGIRCPFHFIGPIPERRRLDIPSLKYWGLIREEKKIQGILRRSDALVCPSYSEGMPTVILEAMASGLPVIATRVGAVDQLVTPENGWLIPPGEPDALRDSLLAALRAPREILDRMGRTSRSMVEREYRWSTVARDTVEAIESVLEGDGEPNR